jgi:GxxExxY protein
LTIAGLKAEQQKPIKVFYKSKVVGEYVADLVVEDCVLVELKTVKNLDEIHLAQCLNYLKATRANFISMKYKGGNATVMERVQD